MPGSLTPLTIFVNKVKTTDFLPQRLAYFHSNFISVVSLPESLVRIVFSGHRIASDDEEDRIP